MLGSGHLKKILYPRAPCRTVLVQGVGLRSEGAGQGNDNGGSSPETVNLTMKNLLGRKTKKVLIIRTL